MRADIDEQPPVPVKDELLERMRALVEPGAVRQCDPATGHVPDDGLDRAAGIVGERIEPEDRLGGRGVQLLVRANHEAERIFDGGQQLLEPLPLGRAGIEQQQSSIGVAPAPHVGDHEQVTTRHLDDRARKFQAILFAGDETGAESRLHVDLDSGKGEITAAAGFGADRVAAFPHRLGGGSRGKTEQHSGDDRRKQASAFMPECELVHGDPPYFRSKVVPCHGNAVQLIITPL
ncbi:hypothetical protein ACVMGC_003452 [Bradyrhizobium barranii subsp. barranii]